MDLLRKHIRAVARPGRLLLLAGLLLSIVVVTGTTMVLLDHRGRTLENSRRELANLSFAVSEDTDRAFQSLETIQSALADRLTSLGVQNSQDYEQKMSGFDVHEILKDKISNLPFVDAITIINADGKLLNFSRYWPIPAVNVSDREYFQALKANPKLATFVSAPVQNRGTGTWTIYLGKSLRTRNGDFIGLILGAVQLSYFEKFYGAIALGPMSHISLFRKDGILLARYPHNDQLIGRSFAADEYFKNASSYKDQDTLQLQSSNDGSERLVAFRALQGYPLMISISTTLDAALAAWRDEALYLLIAASITIIFIFGIVVALSRYMHGYEEKREAERARAAADAERRLQQEALTQSQRFEAAMNNMAQGLCMFDTGGCVIVCNRRYAEMYALPQAFQTPGAKWKDIVHYRERTIGFVDFDLRELDLMRSHLLSRPTAYIRTLKDGRTISIVSQPLLEGGWISVHEDITERRRAEIKQQRDENVLNETKQFLNSIIENVPVSVVVKDAATRKYLLVNRAFENMVEMPRDELLGHTVFDLFRTKDAEFIDRFDTESMQVGNDTHYREYEVEQPKGGHRIDGTRRIVLRGDGGVPKYLIAVIDDITERKKAEHRIAYLAHHDGLTGLANRTTLLQKIEEAGARWRGLGEAFGVLLLDLDRFKQVNDSLGHPAGDRLLTEVAGRLKALLRETDMLARLGGDEFAIIQAGDAEPREAAAALASRIIENIGRPFAINGGEITIGTSIGIALATEHEGASDELLKMADLALYRAKSAGRNGYCFFDPRMSAIATARQEIECDLRRAIQQNEFELHYQPIIDCKTGKICTAEALIRWRHPTKGLIYPDAFIPVAEETGLITQIGDWVLQAACAQAVAWPAEVKVAVNLSVMQFRKPNLADIVMLALAASGLSPRRLELEITETALIESAAECLPTLRQFKRLGITIALDDFGTGYSSLSQLAMFPFDKIKIDKSFTQNLTKRSECAAIISATLTLAQNLDIATTAEGVETADQYRLLRLAGVTSVQGYLFRRPIPAKDIDFNSCYCDAEAA